MKKNSIFLLLVVILAGIAVWLFVSRRNGTMNEELSDFAVKDTGSITKIFIADRTGQQVTLTRQNQGDWLLDGKYEARPDAIKNLLNTINLVEVRSPVGKSAYNNIIKSIAAKGIKVELYSGDKKIKVYYVGGPTQDQLGTFMYIENSSVPYVVHIPGFDGYLTPRYIVRAADWKTKGVFHLNPADLKSLTVIDREHEGGAFQIIRDGKNGFSMVDDKKQPVATSSQDKIISYLQFFGRLNYESEESTLSKTQKDSLLKSIPFRSIELVLTDGTSKMIDFWRRPLTENTTHKTNSVGEEFPFDIDRMTALVRGDSTLIVVQYYSFEKLFKSQKDFMVNNPPK